MACVSNAEAVINVLTHFILFGPGMGCVKFTLLFERPVSCLG